MQKLETIDEARTSDGRVLTLRRRGSEWLVFSGGVVLMSSRQHSSEEELAREAFARVRETKRVLIGGLGLGYTLRAALDELGPHAEVHVIELFGPLVTWNRTYLASLAAAPLEDPRVGVEVSDVAEVLARSAEEWDVILLDVDNGPEALTQASNAQLYGKAGLLRARKALRRGGCLAVWSGGPSPAFAARLREVGFEAEVLQARAHGRAGQRHTLFFGIRNCD